MKKILSGCVYMAHGFEHGVRITDKGYYHFRILDTETVFFDGKVQTIYLGRKIDVDILPGAAESQCFWFDEHGIYDDHLTGLRFELKRKINKI